MDTQLAEPSINAQTPDDSDVDAGNSNTASRQQAGAQARPSRRKEVADQLPFVLRAWWLRQFREYQD
ncbi:MAG: hypothetical protein ACREJM_01810, partial [Candidatus Saccharimonadales bacterium]